MVPLSGQLFSPEGSPCSSRELISNSLHLCWLDAGLSGAVALATTTLLQVQMSVGSLLFSPLPHSTRGQTNCGLGETKEAANEYEERGEQAREALERPLLVLGKLSGT